MPELSRLQINRIGGLLRGRGVRYFYGLFSDECCFASYMLYVGAGDWCAGKEEPAYWLWYNGAVPFGHAEREILPGFFAQVWIQNMKE